MAGLYYKNKFCSRATHILLAIFIGHCDRPLADSLSTVKNTTCEEKAPPRTLQLCPRDFRVPKTPPHPAARTYRVCSSSTETIKKMSNDTDLSSRIERMQDRLFPTSSQRLPMKLPTTRPSDCKSLRDYGARFADEIPISAIMLIILLTK